jgi:hypothetical protein
MGGKRGPTPSASAARHRSDRQWSKTMFNFGSWAGRLHAVLGGCLTVAVFAPRIFESCDIHAWSNELNSLAAYNDFGVVVLLIEGSESSVRSSLR